MGSPWGALTGLATIPPAQPKRRGNLAPPSTEPTLAVECWAELGTGGVNRRDAIPTQSSPELAVAGPELDWDQRRMAVDGAIVPLRPPVVKLIFVNLSGKDFGSELTA